MKSFFKNFKRLLEQYRTEGALISGMFYYFGQNLPNNGLAQSLTGKFFSIAAFSAFTIVLTITVIEHFRQRKSKMFFGFRNRHNLVVAVPTFRWRAPYRATEHYPSDTYKLSRLLPSADIPKPGPALCTFEDTALIAALINSSSLSSVASRNIELEFFDDETIIRHSGLRHSLIASETTLLAYGSDQYNDLSKFVLAHIKVDSGEAAFEFLGDHQLRVHPELGIQVQPTLTTHTTDNMSLGVDYGILAKLVFDSDKKRKNTVFLCAGIDNVATTILVNLFFRYWPVLNRVVKQREFVGFYKFNTDEALDYPKFEYSIMPMGGLFAYRTASNGFSVSGVSSRPKQ